MERFNTSEQNDVTYFKEIFKARNTNKSTDNWIRVYETWAAIRGYDTKKMFEYSPEELNKINSGIGLNCTTSVLTHNGTVCRTI